MARIQYVGRLFEQTFCVERHIHDFWEVVYYTKGNGMVEIGSEIVPFQKNDIFVLPPNVPHTDYSDFGFQDYFYTFQDSGFSRKSYLKFHDTENNDFLKIMVQLYQEYYLKRKNYQEIIDSLYTVLYHYIFALSEESEGNQFVAQVINEIICNISNPNYKISDSLDKVYLTEDYFRKLFFQETGKTPLQYLTYKRISYAKELLRVRENSGLSIQEIAWNAGFSDNYYFSRVFKKLTGYSPKHWMEQEKIKNKDNSG